MNDKKQIEEMAKEIGRVLYDECLINRGHCDYCECKNKETDEYDCQNWLVAKKLLEKYQPKIPEDSIVVKKSILKEELRNLEIQARKETAKAFAEEVKNKIKEIKKRYHEDCINGLGDEEYNGITENDIDEIQKSIDKLKEITK